MSEWTVDTLKVYFEALFSASSDATGIAMTAQQAAVDKAERLAAERALNQDKLAAERGHQQNEWRSALGDLSATKISRDEYDIAHQVMAERVSTLASRLDTAGGQQQGANATVAWILAGVGGLVAVASIVIQLSH